ncbi:MAG: non-canonical purine NTP pyrophosphatase, partial [Deinococcus sp.]|nr:non-canonical purine NTP pyrophosphatase [Deinococcus sp.]
SGPFYAGLGGRFGHQACLKRARFVAVLALAHPDGKMETFRGETEGIILEAPRGEWGFGYDPLFLLPGTGRTYAEMTLEEKALHSHRGKAVRELLQVYATGASPGTQ